MSKTVSVAGNPVADPGVLNVAVTTTTSATFQINNTKLYIPVATFSVSDNIKFLELLKQRFRRAILWNKCRSEIRTEQKNNNLDYMIDPTFRNINKLIVISFKNGDNHPARNSFNAVTCHITRH